MRELHELQLPQRLFLISCILVWNIKITNVVVAERGFMGRSVWEAQLEAALKCADRIQLQTSLTLNEINDRKEKIYGWQRKLPQAVSKRGATRLPTDHIWIIYQHTGSISGLSSKDTLNLIHKMRGCLRSSATLLSGLESPKMPCNVNTSTPHYCICFGKCAQI